MGVRGGAVLAKNESASKPDQRLNLALAAAVSSTTVPPPSLEPPPIASLAPKNRCMFSRRGEEQTHPLCRAKDRKDG